MIDRLTDTNSPDEYTNTSGGTGQRVRRALRTWNDLLDAGVEGRKVLPPLREYPYPAK